MGGMERASVNTANALIDYAQVVFLSVLKKKHFYELNSEVTLIEPQGFNVEKMSFLKTVCWIRTSVREYNPDIILVFNKFYAALTALAVMGVSTQLYISERSSPLYHWSWPFKLIHRLAFSLRPPDGVMAQTSIAAQYQKKYYSKSDVVVIPNVLREVALYPEIKRENIILVVGRPNDYLKGIDMLIEAVSLLKNQDWTVHIAGGEVMDSGLHQMIEDYRLHDRVLFLGKIQDIDKHYASAGIYVIPSRSEGFPNALAEAMAAGCPCIAFDFIAGPRDMIIHQVSGIIVENGNVAKLAEAIDVLIASPEERQRLGKAAISIRQKLNKEVILQKMIKFLKLN